nr:MAG TPA: outer membrane protein assembly factor [Caudoviricetes sp.]
MKSRIVKFAAVCAAAIVLCGCAETQPQIIARTSYQDVDKPVRCDVELPPKPSFDESDPATAGAVAAYYEEVERLLLLCVGEKP